jgi:hypothetical protein
MLLSFVFSSVCRNEKSIQNEFEEELCKCNDMMQHLDEGMWMVYKVVKDGGIAAWNRRLTDHPLTVEDVKA